MQRGDRSGRPARRAEQPQQERHVLERVAQRARRGRGRRSSTRRPRPRARRRRGLGARDDADRVALGDERAGQVEPAAAAADDAGPSPRASRGSRRPHASRAAPRRPSRRVGAIDCAVLGIAARSRPRRAAARRAARGVDRLAHLVEVVDLVLHLDLGRARRAPVELLGARSPGRRRPRSRTTPRAAAQKPDHDEHERVHGSCESTGRWPPWPTSQPSPAAVCRRGTAGDAAAGLPGRARRDGRLPAAPRAARDRRAARLGDVSAGRGAVYAATVVRTRDAEPPQPRARRPRRGLPDDEPRRGRRARRRAPSAQRVQRALRSDADAPVPVFEVDA